MDAGTEAAEKVVLRRLMEAKKASKKSYSEIAEETGLTNVYVAQLLRRQAHLKPDTAEALRAAVPGLTDDLIEEMKKPPFRSYRPNLLHDPAVYRYQFKTQFLLISLFFFAVKLGF